MRKRRRHSSHSLRASVRVRGSLAERADESAHPWEEEEHSLQDLLL